MNINMRDIKNKIKVSGFAKSVVMIAGGTASAQVINVLMTPIITRMYTPEEFGVLALFIAVLGLLSTIASLRYEWAIPIAKDDEETTSVIALSFIVLLFMTAIISLLLVIGGKNMLDSLGVMNLWKYRYLIPLGVFSVGLYNIMLQLSFRVKNYRGISKTKFNQAISQNFSKILFGLLQFGSPGLIIGNIIGQSAGITTLASSAIKTNKFTRSSISKQKIMDCSKRYIKFPIYSASSQFFNSAGVQLPTIIMTAIYGSKVVGYYGLANSIISIPMVLIGNSIGDVFYGEAASIGRKRPEELKRLSSSLFKKLVLIGLLPLLILILAGAFLFSFVFGASWYQAGVYAQILATLVFFRLIFTPISRIYSVFERQKEAFVIDLLRVIFVVIVFGIAYLLELKPHYAVGLYTLAMSFIYFITYVIAQRIINSEISKKNESMDRKE